jgi:5-methylcytosine-specific restriction endonuclease McrA
VGLKYCLTCAGHHPVGYRCPKVEAKRYRASAARKARGRHAWRLAREAARRRDGNCCRRCGSTQGLQVHHVTPVSEGGERYALDNLVTLCSSCHAAQHRGRDGATGNDPALPRVSFSRKKPPQPRPRFSRNTLKDVEGPLIG